MILPKEQDNIGSRTQGCCGGGAPRGAGRCVCVWGGPLRARRAQLPGISDALSRPPDVTGQVAQWAPRSLTASPSHSLPEQVWRHRKPSLASADHAPPATREHIIHVTNVSQVPECPEQEPPRKDEASQASRRDGGLPARLPICKAAESIQFIEEAPERPRRVGVK